MMTETFIIKKIFAEICSFDTIIIIRHINPDGDAFGSQLGLKKLIQYNWPEKKVYSVGSTNNLFPTLGSMDEISDSIFSEALVIVTDSASEKRIDDNRWTQAKKVIKIDHHPNQYHYGQLEWVDDTFTSASEMIAWFGYLNKLKITADIGQTIMCGIITDSNRFYAQSVSSRTFLACSYLMHQPWDITELITNIYQFYPNYLLAQAEVIKGMQIVDGVGALFLTAEIMEKYQIPFEKNDIFTNLLQGVTGIDIIVVFSANQDKSYRVEFRSNKVTIKEIAEKYGGGGHNVIAGATIASLNLSQAIIRDLQELLKNKKERGKEDGKKTKI